MAYSVRTRVFPPSDPLAEPRPVQWITRRTVVRAPRRAACRCLTVREGVPVPLATTAKSRKRSPATAPTFVAESPRLAERRSPLVRPFVAVGHLIDRLPHLALVDRFHREVLGVALLFLAGLSGWALARGEQDGRLVVWSRDVLVSAYGQIGGWLVPVFLLLVSIRVFRDLDESILRPHHYIGGFALAVAGLGLLEMGVGRAGFHPGGNLGIGVATVTVDILGEVAAGVALYLIGTVAVFLLSSMSLVRFYHEVRWLLPVKGTRADHVADDDFDAWPDDGDDADERIGLSGSIPALPFASADPAERGNGRFQRRRGLTGGSALDNPRQTGPVHAVGDIDVDLAILTPPRRLNAQPSSPAEFDEIVAHGSAEEDQIEAAEPVIAPHGRRSRAARESSVSQDTPTLGAVVAAAAELTPEPVPLAEAMARAVVPVQAPLREPVINVPHRQSRPAPVAAAVAAVVPILRTTLGEPMPLPSIGQLPYYEAHKPNTAELEAKARLIQEKLASFKVQAWVREINTGPAVTQFALEPGDGVKVRRITELQNDLALALAAPQIRIEAPVPGHARVGIEVPNDQIMTVGLRETLESPAYLKGKQKLPIPLGLDVNGKYIVGDLARMPHLLIAGATGSGKSVCINGIISTFLLTRRPDEVKLLLIDPKMVELVGYNGVPHLQCPVVTEMGKVVPALRLVLREMERRYTLFSTLGVRNLDGYRLKVADEPGAENLPYLVVIIDELADLMMTTPVEVESLLQRLTQMARATGIHLILATQRPSVDVITGIIKSNVPARIAFMVSSMTDSRVILDAPGAERLLGRGDMLFVPPDAAKPQRIQGVFVADEDVSAVVDHWQAVVPIPQYAQEWIDLPSVTDAAHGSSGDGDGEEDALWDQAIEIVRKQGTASASMLQRRLRIGYNRAARLIQEMEDQEIIGPADGIKGRTVFLADESA